jgi:hypothetical protein
MMDPANLSLVCSAVYLVNFCFSFFFAAGIHASILYAIAFSMHTPGPVIHNWNILLDGEIQIEMIYRVLPS